MHKKKEKGGQNKLISAWWRQNDEFMPVMDCNLYFQKLLGVKGTLANDVMTGCNEEYIFRISGLKCFAAHTTRIKY